ncbi:MAG: lamin tail domain-containing protein [Porphyromonas sp.]|nr:lamin tail domain-containing protein [Porphyromonas sp.]
MLSKKTIISNGNRSWALIVLQLLFFLPLTAQEWEGGWQGDRHLFHYESGRITYLDDDFAGSARLWCDYSLPPSGVTAWEFRVEFESLPTGQNGFSLVLFSEERGSYLYQYSLRPEENGRLLSLSRANYHKVEGNRWEKLSEQTIVSHSVLSPAIAWQSLYMQLRYDPQRGVQLITIGHLDDPVISEWFPLMDGVVLPRMELKTHFTSRKKLNYHYYLPVVLHQDKEEPPLQWKEVKVEERGRVLVQLNQPVDVSKAKVLCEGLQPQLFAGATPDQLVIEMGAAFLPDTTYDVEVTGLQTFSGEVASISFVIQTEPSKPSSIEVPYGLFITEVMADPPNSGPLRYLRYIELLNNTDQPVQLGQLQLQYRISKHSLPPAVLSPGAFAILYPAEELPPTREATLVPLESFPALSGSFYLALLSGSGAVVDELHFTSRLYGEGEIKGKAALERVGYQPDFWRRSNHPDGGTPGKRTTLVPFRPVPKGSIVINELMLSPKSTGERYIELYNRSSEAVELTDIYLTYANKQEQASAISWIPVRLPQRLEAGAYVVLSPFPEALTLLHPKHDSETFVERIDFPSISPTYSEIELRTHLDDEVIDRVISRRQWLGRKSTDRTGYALERRSPDLDGTLRSSWRRATEESAGGTPGVANSVLGLPPAVESDEEGTAVLWPEDPELTFEQLAPLLAAYPHLARIELFTLTGQPLMQASGTEVGRLLQQLQHGRVPLPTIILIVQVRLHDPEQTPATLTYRGKHLHLIM